MMPLKQPQKDEDQPRNIGKQRVCSNPSEANALLGINAPEAFSLTVSHLKLLDALRKQLDRSVVLQVEQLPAPMPMPAVASIAGLVEPIAEFALCYGTFWRSRLWWAWIAFVHLIIVGWEVDSYWLTALDAVLMILGDGQLCIHAVAVSVGSSDPKELAVIIAPPREACPQRPSECKVTVFELSEEVCISSHTISA